MPDEIVVENNITNLETEETTVEESQETLESGDSENIADDGLTDKAREFKEKRREENRLGREALARIPKIEAELEKQKFYKGQPDAEDYEKEIDDFRANNPKISLAQAYKYVLADVDPAKLAEISDSGAANQAKQSRTSINDSEKSFSDQVNGTKPTTLDGMKSAALQEAKTFVF